MIFCFKGLNTLSPLYLGCFFDFKPNRNLPNQMLNTLPMTIDYCVTRCLNLRYTLAGLQQG